MYITCKGEYNKMALSAIHYPKQKYIIIKAINGLYSPKNKNLQDVEISSIDNYCPYDLN
jgi:hypothetical protein